MQMRVVVVADVLVHTWNAWCTTCVALNAVCLSVVHGRDFSSHNLLNDCIICNAVHYRFAFRWECANVNGVHVSKSAL